MSTYTNELWIDWEYIVLGEKCFNRFVYTDNGDLIPTDTQACVDEWVATVLPEFLDCQHVSVLTTKVTGQLYVLGHAGSPGHGLNTTLALGNVAGSCLAAFITAAAQLVPDNATRLPISAPPFSRKGRKAISGIAEESIGGIGYEAGFLLAFQDALDAALTLPVAGGGGRSADFRWSMLKLIAPGATPTVAAQISDVFVGHVGTQNTRKG